VAPGGRDPVAVPFGPGDAVVAFTDGLIERRTEDIDVGQRRLLEALPALGSRVDADLEEALVQLVDEVRDHTRDDDIAVLAVRRG
jgi:serine phosphatase RsbU (regulator of sigma subunit)